MNGQSLGGSDRAALVDGLADHIDDSAEGLGAHRHLNGVAGVDDGLATHEALRRVERNRAHAVATQVLGDLEHESVLRALDLQSVVDGRQFAVELDIDDGTDHLRNLAAGGAEATYL